MYSTLRTCLESYDDTKASLVIHSPDSTLGGAVESIERMTKAALYARVSTDAQQKEGTIESQVAELKRQIAEAGHVLVREYIDDGISGTLLDRPGLEQLRQDVKTDQFDAIDLFSLRRSHRPRGRVSNHHRRRTPEAWQAGHHQRQGLRPQSREQVDADHAGRFCRI